MQSHCCNKQLWLIKVWICSYTIWSPPEQVFSQEQNAVTQTDSCSLTVVCSLSPLSPFKVFFNCSSVHFTFVLPPKKIGLFCSAPPPPRLPPHWTEPKNGPFPLHFPRCWMSNGGSQRSRNILLEWYFESTSPPPPVFLPLSWWNSGMRRRNSSHRAKMIQSYSLNERLQAPVFWVVLFSFYFLLGRRITGGGKKEPSRNKKKERKKKRAV